MAGNNLVLTINADPKLIDSINKLASAISNRPIAEVTETQQEEKVVKAIAPLRQQEQAPEEMSEKSAPELNRQELVDKINALGGKIPLRTRTTTLVKMLASLEGSTARTKTEEPKELTKAEVIGIVSEYLKAGGDDQALSRREQVRGILNDLNAVNLAELAPNKYSTLIEKLQGE